MARTLRGWRSGSDRAAAPPQPPGDRGSPEHPAWQAAPVTPILHRWEWVALALVCVGALAWWLPRLTGRDPWLALARRIPPRLGAVLRGPAGDALLLGGTLVAVAVPLVGAWRQLSPHRFVSGPDAEGYLATAIGLEVADVRLLADDRYPAFPWLVSLLAPDRADIATVGTTLSMACMVGCTVPIYAVLRPLAGRAAAVAGALLALRQILVVDVGQTWTSYPLVTLLDLSLLAFALHALSPRAGVAITSAVGFAATGALACATDPKQIPLVLGSGGVLALTSLLRGRPWLRPLVAAFALAPILIAHLAMQRYPARLLSVEALVMRTPGSVQSEAFAARAHDDGFVLGQPGALGRLPATLLALQREVRPDPTIQRDKRLAQGLALAWPRTSALWPLLGLALPLLLLTVALRRRDPRPATVALLLVGQLAAALPLVQIYYAHRWALPTLVLLPAATAGSVGLLAGPLGAAGLAVAAIALPQAPLARVDATYLRTGEVRGGVRETDAWTMGEDRNLYEVLERAAAELPPETPWFDFTGTQPVTALALRFPYVSCRGGQDCRTMGAHRPIGAVLRLSDGVTARLPGGTGAELPREQGFPKAVGCWQYRDWVRHDVALYTWDCPEPPGDRRVPAVIVPGAGRMGPPPLREGGEGAPG